MKPHTYYIIFGRPPIGGKLPPPPSLAAPLCAAVSACIDIDECSYYNGGCSSHAFCNNTAAGYSCNCHPGYTGDGVHCAGPYHIHSCQHTVLTVFAGTLAQLFSRSTCVQSALDAFRNVRRIFVRGSMPVCRLRWRKF